MLLLILHCRNEKRTTCQSQVGAWSPARSPVHSCHPGCLWASAHARAVPWPRSPALLPADLQWGNPRSVQGPARLPHAGASAVCSSSCWKPRNVPAHWGHLTPRGGRDKQRGVLYVAYLTAEIIFKMVLTYIVLTQQLLILHYLGNVLCTKLCLEMSLTQILLFAITCSLDMHLNGGTISSMRQD